MVKSRGATKIDAKMASWEAEEKNKKLEKKAAQPKPGQQKRSTKEKEKAQGGKSSRGNRSAS